MHSLRFLFHAGLIAAITLAPDSSLIPSRPDPELPHNDAPLTSILRTETLSLNSVLIGRDFRPEEVVQLVYRRAAQAMADWDRLTKRERQIVALAAIGKVDKEIALELWISVGTVKDQFTRNIYPKLHLEGDEARVRAASIFHYAEALAERNKLRLETPPMKLREAERDVLARWERLTARHKQYGVLIAAGFTVKEIATILGLSAGGVRATQSKFIHAKYGFSGRGSREQIAGYIITLGGIFERMEGFSPNTLKAVPHQQAISA